MSAHVVPKAKSFADDEKTELESQWEDEASTTVEQGEVADKIRDFNAAGRRQITGGTNTGSSQLDEPTVDDQHVPALSALTPPVSARLAITAGNDAGAEIEIVPGKTYTIGRGLDNDIVLTDISVSRKHFDLQHEQGSWVIVDRGSGNGTVINGNLEDNPFMLANGDVIEIGNTVFRFDQQDSAVRRASFGVDSDDEEMSTVAGKAMRGDVPLDPETPQSLPRERAKTLPPPTPLRPRPITAPPPVSAFAGMSPLQSAPVSTLPMNQANRAPAAMSHGPSMLGEPAPLAPAPRSPLQAMQPAAPAMLPTTLPGQGPSRPIYAYPQVGDIPAQQLQAQMHLIAAQQNRGDHSTAHHGHGHGYSYPPPQLAQVPLRYQQASMSRRAKLVLGSAITAVGAAIAAVAIMQCGGARRTSAASMAAKPTVVSMKDGNAKAEAPKPTSDLAAALKSEPSKPAPPPTPPPPPVKPDAVKPAAGSAVTATPPPPVDPSKVAKQDPPKADPPKQQDPPRPDPPKQQDPPKTDARKTVRPQKRAPQPTAVPSPPPPPRRVAVATMTTDEAKQKADDLYKGRRFNDASNLLAAQAKQTSDENEARQLRYLSQTYAKLGRALSSGSAGSSIDSFEALRNALDYDGVLGHAFDSEISKQLAEVAPKAAISYSAAKNYEKAHIAVQTAEKVGSTSPTLRAAKQNLESRAAELYAAAIKELDSDPEDAKDKLRTIEKMVDVKSPWYGKARQKLGS